MGLTRSSVGDRVSGDVFKIKKKKESDLVIALAGNPNVGKSTVFNELTGMNQHTGNWPGKTVSNAAGYFEHTGQGFVLVDIPGTYSLLPASPEEEVARDFLISGDYDCVAVVCDATSLERNLALVLQIRAITPHIVVCVNLMDEARKKGITVDVEVLKKELGVEVVATEARSGKGLSLLCDALLRSSGKSNEIVGDFSEDFPTIASEIYHKAVSGGVGYTDREKRIDRIVTSRVFGFPIMLLGLALVFWLTIEGANYPSTYLSSLFSKLESPLYNFLTFLRLPEVVSNALTYGVFRVLSWVVSVMLPPMAIFFPLFTLLEDSGYLPRVAFNLDRAFLKCNACGKQSLTMCMGFGCNAAGVVGCRIIDSPRERLIAILTNSFVPCNGRFPALISIITIFFIGHGSGIFKSATAALILVFFVLLGIAMTFLISKLLSHTFCRGYASNFTLELPPYRRPQIVKVLIRSIFDRTLFVLGRAVAVAAPAGLVIWLMANITFGGETLLSHLSNLLDPFGRLLGLDGVILTAFILGFPANEIVLPLAIMAYSSGGVLTEISDLASVSSLLISNGWTRATAISFMLFSIFHWPCSTTLLTVKKETGSFLHTLLALLIPTLLGIILCALVNLFFV